VTKAKLGQDEQLSALERLDREARRLERVADGPPMQQIISEESERSHAHGGRSVFGWEQASPRAKKTRGAGPA
jgi:uncharacterized protein